MSAHLDADGIRASRDANDTQDDTHNRTSDLDDSWFKWPKPPTIPPQPRSEPPPPMLDDGLADGWFR